MENSYKFFQNNDCKYFPCHNKTGDFNCMFCYCPMYRLESCLGKPNYIDKGDRVIKDCTNCTFPHEPDNYDRIIEVLRKEK